MLSIGSLFSGIGGLELGLEASGLGKTVWQVENDPYCHSVLEKHWPDALRWHDVREITPPYADLICGGFPCQDLSGARRDKGEGLAGSRSGLWYEFARIVKHHLPRWVVVENVHSGAARWVDTVVSELEFTGYECLPVQLSAEDVGAPHLRRRVFVIGKNAHSHRGRLERTTEEQGPPEHAFRSPGDRCPGWAQTEPGVGRVVHGLPYRVDRIKALGNSVVPRCSEVIGAMIIELEQCAANPALVSNLIDVTTASMESHPAVKAANASES